MTRDWDKALKLDHSKFKSQPGYIRDLMDDLEERLSAILHGFTSGETLTGIKLGTFITVGTGAGSIPSGTGAATAINLYCRTDGTGTAAELYAMDKEGNETKITLAGKLNAVWLTLNQTIAGIKTFTDGIIADITGNVTGNLTGNVTGNLTGNVTGNVSGSSGSCTGNAATATAAVNGFKCWIHFDGTGTIAIRDSYNVSSIVDNGTGTIAIRDSYNVSSIVDNGTGYYSIYWDTNFANIYYSCVGSSNLAQTYVPAYTEALNVDYLNIETKDSNGSLTDASVISLIAIGDQ